jgi:hypothetical protein
MNRKKIFSRCVKRALHLWERPEGAMTHNGAGNSIAPARRSYQIPYTAEGCDKRTLPRTVSRRPPRTMAGLSYVEVLVAIVLLSMALVPAIDAFQPAIMGSGIHRSHTEQHYHLTEKLEELLAEPFSALDAEAVVINDPTVASDDYSDPTTAANRRLVYLSRYDGDNADGDFDYFTGLDAGLVWVRVEHTGTGQTIERLISVYD